MRKARDDAWGGHVNDNMCRMHPPRELLPSLAGLGSVVLTALDPTRIGVRGLRSSWLLRTVALIEVFWCNLRPLLINKHNVTISNNVVN
jgi:hypothetical protein